MAYLIAAPEMFAAAAADVAGIGSSVGAATAAAASTDHRDGGCGW